MCFCSHVDMCIYGVVPIFMQVLKLKEEFHKKKKVAFVAPCSLNLHWL